VTQRCARAGRDDRSSRHDAIDPLHDRRESWVLDETLIPTRDHSRAAKSKNCRWSCNAQILIRRRDLRIVATTAGGPGNRNDPVHYRGSCVEQLCQEHGRVLAVSRRARMRDYFLASGFAPTNV
jgi:hypothetical protein